MPIRPAPAAAAAPVILASASAASARIWWSPAWAIGGTFRSEGANLFGDSGFRRLTRTQLLFGSVMLRQASSRAAVPRTDVSAQTGITRDTRAAVTAGRTGDGRQ